MWTLLWAAVYIFPLTARSKLKLDEQVNTHTKTTLHLHTFHFHLLENKSHQHKLSTHTENLGRREEKERLDLEWAGNMEHKIFCLFRNSKELYSALLTATGSLCFLSVIHFNIFDLRLSWTLTKYVCKLRLVLVWVNEIVRNVNLRWAFPFVSSTKSRCSSWSHGLTRTLINKMDVGCLRFVEEVVCWYGAL